MLILIFLFIKFKIITLLVIVFFIIVVLLVLEILKYFGFVFIISG